MELNMMHDVFDRVAKKQKLLSSRTQELIDQVGWEIEQAKMKMQPSESPTGCTDPKSILVDLKTKLNEIAPINQLEGLQKELNFGLGKYVKTLEKCFNSDISKAHRKVEFDVHIVNQIIATHFYRHGMFNIGDCFIREANEPEAAAIKSAFLEMHETVEAMRCRNLEPALSWASKQSEWLLQNGSSLELKLHQLQFVEILQNGSRNEALTYARTRLAPFAPVHMVTFQKLMACLLWAGKIHQSPYADFMLPSHWERVAEEFMQRFCSLLGQSYQSPLGVTIGAGIQGLPVLLKIESVMAAKKQEWLTMTELPVPVDLGREFHFHSIFICPVLKEQGSDENPPMMIPCGHVLSKQSIVKLSKNSTRAFKCPYCPSEATDKVAAKRIRTDHQHQTTQRHGTEA
ncbi:unnamed protein product, partial [Musa textilis]